MTTRVKYVGIDFTGKCPTFETDSKESIVLRGWSFKDEIADVWVTGDTVRGVIETIIGCFDSKSNFKTELGKILTVITSVKGIRTVINDVSFVITEENADVKLACREFFLKRDREEKKYASRDELKIFDIDEKTEMLFKNAKAAKEWENWVDLNIGTYPVTFARRWAKYMQYVIEKEKKTVAECARDTSVEFNPNVFDGYTYSSVINVLARCWKYGDELLKWYKEGMK